MRTGLLDELVAVAVRAGSVIMDHRGRADARLKADRSPVTDADEAAEALIIAALNRLTPDVPVIAEEMMSGPAPAGEAGALFWLVDPLDGTREFLGGNGEFTVNIALVEERRVTLAVVGAPARGLIYASDGTRSWCRQANGGEAVAIRTRQPPESGMTAAMSRSHRDRASEAFLESLPVTDEIIGGSSLKFCLLAEGRADVYPRFGRTMEWDTAAGHGILEAAGGAVREPDGGAFLYGKPGFVNPPFVAWGSAPP
ncbi:MAG: 3'(2'),5'-bisphosphate nucleotidase CysQ [Alphaproteobacteria bacterium]|nr:3'(2'),5'-bisphosphate nucleotidase CysQ [Alphaproteobacteria bacterium]